MSRHLKTYDTIRFALPAPLALVTSRNISTGASALAVPMLLDSGADVSLAPRQTILPLGFSIDPAAVYELLRRHAVILRPGIPMVNR